MTQVYKYKLAPQSPKEASCCSSPMDELFDADLFKALGDPTRLVLLSCLVKCSRPCSVTEIAECCSVDFSVVSRHLKILSESGILSSLKKGREVYYEVSAELLSSLFQKHADAILKSRMRPSTKKSGSRCEC